MVKGDGPNLPFDLAHGDAAVVTDRKTGEMLMMCASGDVWYWQSTLEKPNRVGRYYSKDGINWQGEEITKDIYGLMNGAVHKLFFTSGRICQSKKIKAGKYYRIYSALCSNVGNVVLYSDDFGRSWLPLGGAEARPTPYGDEAKVEELPNGDVLLCSRSQRGKGRIFNIFNYKNAKKAEGKWQEQALLDGNYKAAMCNGEVLMVDNPLDYPDPADIQLAEEPFVKASLIAPQEYVGNIMELCQDRRGEFKDMVYLDSVRVELHYEMPLNEIIYDFFDALKSRTRGYGSLDYELIGYRPSRLVKLDILLNGDIVDALSFILFADNAYPRARKICEKLKDNIPRAQFEIPVQAAIGGKIIARETIKALRKDVLAKCYGGDVTRKKKLLEKQKEGKKRMRTFGTVSVPSEAFMAVLKLDED